MDEFLQPNERIILILENSKELAWERAKIQNCDEILLWYPITYIVDENRRLGVTKSGFWAIEVEQQIKLLNRTTAMRDLLPCLETEYCNIASQVEEGLIRANLPTELFSTFPSQALIVFALSSQSNFWTDLALDWLNGIKIDEKIAMELEKIVSNSGFSQKTRQKASKHLKKAKREVIDNT